MSLTNSINKFYFDMTFKELAFMNSLSATPDITYNSLLYLDIIAYTDNCTASYIAENLNISKSAVTLKVNELIKQGFVKKTQSSTDKRINYLTVSDEMKDDYRVYDLRLHGAIKEIEKKYTEKEVETFCEILENLSKGYRPTA